MFICYLEGAQSGAPGIASVTTDTTIDDACTKQAINHEGLNFTTFYPGGLYGTCSFFIPMKANDPHTWIGSKRVVINNGLEPVWEGDIEIITPLRSNNKEGLQIECTGKWGTVLKRRYWNKIWCDTRLTDKFWEWQETEGTADQFRNDRRDRLYIYPSVATFGTTDYAAFRYTMPTGQSIPRITCAFDFNEAAQAWSISAFDVTGGTVVREQTATGTGTWDLTTGGTCAALELRFNSKAAQSIANYDSGIYGEFTNIKVYGESGTISLDNVVKDIRGHFNELSADEQFISANTQVVEPCFTEWESAADLLTRLSSFGDASNNAWAAGLRPSTDGSAILYYEQQPALTDYDYSVRIEEIEGEFKTEWAFDEIVNWIILQYTDENGDQVWITPDDDATLKDTTSITSYGQKEKVLKLGNVGLAEAVNYAIRYKNANRYSKKRLTGPVKKKGFIRTKAKDFVPVSMVRAGTRLLIENYLQELDGSGIMFLITSTAFDEETETLTIRAGTPNPLEVLAGRLKR